MDLGSNLAGGNMLSVSSSTTAGAQLPWTPTVAQLRTPRLFADRGAVELEPPFRLSPA